MSEQDDWRKWIPEGSQHWMLMVQLEVAHQRRDVASPTWMQVAALAREYADAIAERDEAKRIVDEAAIRAHQWQNTAPKPKKCAEDE